jgi:hypothetical protein
LNEDDTLLTNEVNGRYGVMKNTYYDDLYCIML